MRRFIAAAAAVSAAATACAAGTSGYSGSDAGLVTAEDGGGPVEASLPPTADAATDDAAGNDPTDGPLPDAGSSDGASPRDAGASIDTGGGRGPLDAAPPALSGSCDPTQWVVSASTSATNNPPAFAIDGLPPTRWSTGAGQAVGQYFQIDFGGPVVLSGITLDDSYGTSESADYPRGLDVLGSSDGINFGTTLTTTSFATDPGAVATISFSPSTTSAIRMQVTTGVPTVWWAIHELRLDCRVLEADGGMEVEDGGAGAGDAAPSCAATSGGWTAGAGVSATNWKGSASSTGPNDTVAGAFDDNSTTRWSSGQAQAGGEWYKLDLGQTTSLSGVALYLLDGNTGDYPSSYALQLSSDDLAYTTVATGLGAATTAICLPEQSARYMKVTQTGTGDASWWSVYEITVFP